MLSYYIQLLHETISLWYYSSFEKRDLINFRWAVSQNTRKSLSPNCRRLISNAKLVLLTVAYEKWSKTLMELTNQNQYKINLWSLTRELWTSIFILKVIKGLLQGIFPVYLGLIRHEWPGNFWIMVTHTREFLVKLTGNICSREENFMAKYFEMSNLHLMPSLPLLEKDRPLLKDCTPRIIALTLLSGLYFVVINNVSLNSNKIKL